MKKFLKITALITAALLSLGILVGCGGGGSEDDSWKPTGEDVTLMQSSTPITTLILFGTPEETAKTAANEFKTALNASKVGVVNTTFSASVMSDSSEVIFGESDRTASIKAKELYSQKKSGLYSWVFYYYDGKLAIYAEDAVAYSLAVEDFFKLYLSGTSIIFKDTLAECHSLTAEEYDEYLDELERVTIDQKREENAEDIPDLLKDIDKQRTELKDNRTFDIRTATENMMSLTYGSSWGTAPVNPIDEHPRVMFTKDDIPGIRRALREDTATNEYFFQLLDADFDGILKPVSYTPGSNQNAYNYNGTDLEKIMVKALAYQLYDDPYYGYQAIYAVKNYLATLEFIYISGDQYRQFGDVGFTVACVYDWCYDLLTDEDKDQIIAATENVIFKGSNEKGVKFEIGFPPTQQGSFTGHGSEYQLLRDYLSFAIAIYDENPTWYQLIGARFYNDYVPSRNYYFESTGVAAQGTSYLTLRHLATFYSAWLATAGMGANPYNNLLQTMYSFAAYEYSPGYIFTDGDGAGVQTTSNLRDAEFMAAYLFGDSTLLALAEITLADGKITHATQGLGCAMYTIIRGKGTQPVENPYDNMELIQYNGSPLGQYIVREAWNTSDSAAIFMKLKERHTANHEHGDAGSFQIYYKGMLSSEAGVYDNYNADHTQKFYKSSVSHNTLLIKNHKNTDIYHVGAQRTFTEARSLEIWLNNDYEAGVITGREHAYTDASKTSPLYAYLAGDITQAYDSTTVSYVGRRMLTVYTGNEDFPMAFFVYDDISSKNVAFKKTFLLQITSAEEPEVSTKKQTVITENGDGRLVLTCLTDDVTIDKVGGRVYDAKGNYDPVNSKNYLINGRQLVTLNKKDDGHWGRIEISLSGGVNHTFMNVMYVTDKGQTKAAPNIEYIKSEGVEGATFGDVAVIFATSRDRITSELKASVKGSGDMSYYVSGVAEGKWSVSVGGKSIGTFEATKDGGLLTFTAPAGELKITPAK